MKTKNTLIFVASVILLLSIFAISSQAACDWGPSECDCDTGEYLVYHSGFDSNIGAGAGGFQDVNNVLGLNFWGKKQWYLVYCRSGRPELYRVSVPKFNVKCDTPNCDPETCHPQDSDNKCHQRGGADDEVPKRTFTFIRRYLGGPDCGNTHESFYVNDSGIYWGYDDNGDIHHWDFDGTYNGVVENMGSTIGGSIPETMSYDSTNDIWWTGTRDRDLYYWDGSHWIYEVTHPATLDGSHHDGLAIFGDKLVAAEMTSDDLFTYDITGPGQLDNCEHYSYSYSPGVDLENMGAGPFDHVWATSGSGYLYELGGGDLVFAVCGNRKLDPGEFCDLSYTEDNDGDGIIDGVGLCDSVDTCDMTDVDGDGIVCECLTYCGDGIRQPVNDMGNPEDCDGNDLDCGPVGSGLYCDMNNSDGDGACLCKPDCGDGIMVTPPEDCDAGDGTNPAVVAAADSACQSALGPAAYCKGDCTCDAGGYRGSLIPPTAGSTASVAKFDIKFKDNSTTPESDIDWGFATSAEGVCEPGTDYSGIPNSQTITKGQTEDIGNITLVTKDGEYCLVKINATSPDGAFKAQGFYMVKASSVICPHCAITEIPVVLHPITIYSGDANETKDSVASADSLVTDLKNACTPSCSDEAAAKLDDAENNLAAARDYNTDCQAGGRSICRLAQYYADRAWTLAHEGIELL